MSELPQIEKVFASVPVSSLLKHPRNPNQGDVGAISTSIEQIGGTYKPIVVQKSTRFILAGNHTYEAMIQLGYETVDVCVVDVDDQIATNILLADNHLAELAVRDLAQVTTMLEEIQNQRGSIEGTGYTPDDLDDMLAILGKPHKPKESKEVHFTASIEEGHVRCPRCQFEFKP